jgi:hypothetical protein
VAEIRSLGVTGREIPYRLSRDQDLPRAGSHLAEVAMLHQNPGRLVGHVQERLRLAHGHRFVGPGERLALPLGIGLDHQTLETPNVVALLADHDLA